MRLRLLGALALLMAGTFPSHAMSECTGKLGARPYLSGPLVIAASYDPTHPGDTVATGAVTLVSPQPCSLDVTIGAGQGPALRGNTLRIQYRGFLDSARQGQTRLRIGSSQQFTGTVMIPSGQMLPAGQYTETLPLVFSEAGNVTIQTTVVLSITILSACVLPPPTQSSIDLTHGLHDGSMRQGFRQTTAIPGTSCTGRARLTLSGTPLGLPGMPAHHRIGYHVRARFGGRVLTFDPDIAPEASLDGAESMTGLSIEVTTKASARLPAGQYRATITIMVSPLN